MWVDRVREGLKIMGGDMMVAVIILGRTAGTGGSCSNMAWRVMASLEVETAESVW